MQAGISTQQLWLIKAVKLTSVVFWLGIIWFVRGLSEDPKVVFVLGFAPDFFAALAIYFDAADRSIRRRGYASVLGLKAQATIAIGVVVLLFIGELLQEFVFGGNMDAWDIEAHCVGALWAILVLRMILGRDALTSVGRRPEK